MYSIKVSCICMIVLLAAAANAKNKKRKKKNYIKDRIKIDGTFNTFMK